MIANHQGGVYNSPHADHSEIPGFGSSLFRHHDCSGVHGLRREGRWDPPAHGNSGANCQPGSPSNSPTVDIFTFARTR